MQGGLRKNIIAFITSDVKNESETKELAVLVRILCSIFSVYYLLISILIASQGFYIYALILIFAIGLLIGAFICTYENKTGSALKLLNLVLLSVSSILSVKVGFSYSYHWLMFITIFLAFYDYNSSLKRKFYFAGFVGALAIFITVLCLIRPLLRVPSPAVQITILILNIIVLILSMTFIAYFYRSKFIDSEAKIIQYNKKLLQMASQDALTQLPNRRTMNEHLKDLVFSNGRSGEPFCIAIGDVDLFKRINDEYGHDTGDYVLCTISSSFQDFMHGKGMASRWGGEEFLFTFEKVHIGQALYELKKLSEAISSYQFTYKEYKFYLTMTFGLEEYQEHLGVETVISKADQKLYFGKKHGRNQVVS